MKFSRIGEPLGSRYRMVKEGLAGQNSAYLDAVVRVLGQPSFGNDRRKNELAYMSLAAMYLLPERLDEELISLLAKRMTICKQVGRIKQKTRSPIYVPEREAEILAEKARGAKNLGLPEDFTLELFSTIMAESRRLQQIEWTRLDSLV